MTIKREENAFKYRYSQFHVQGILPSHKMETQQINTDSRLQTNEGPQYEEIERRQINYKRTYEETEENTIQIIWMDYIPTKIDEESWLNWKKIKHYNVTSRHDILQTFVGSINIESI